MSTKYKLNIKELGSGFAFIALALGFGLYTLFDLRIGTPRQMGPGLFPIVVSTLLGFIGLLIVFRASKVEITKIGNISWRGIIFVIGAVIAFALTLGPLGLALATFIAGFLASSATPRNSVKVAATIALILTVLCVGLFVYALGLPINVLGSWFTGY